MAPICAEPWCRRIRGDGRTCTAPRANTAIMTSFRTGAMDRKGGLALQAISPAGRDNQQAGFTLIEVVCVLAILAMAAAVVLPLVPRGTSQVSARSLRAVDRRGVAGGSSCRHSAARRRRHRRGRQSAIDPFGRDQSSGVAARRCRYGCAVTGTLRQLRHSVGRGVLPLRDVVRRCHHLVARGAWL